MKHSQTGHPHSITHKGGGEGSSQMPTIAYKGPQNLKTFFGPQNLKTFLFCTKEAITLPFIIVIEKCRPKCRPLNCEKRTEERICGRDLTSETSKNENSRNSDENLNLNKNLLDERVKDTINK